MSGSGWPIRGTTPRPYDVADLAHALGLDPADTHALATTIGIGRRWIRRYRDAGLTERQAETWALAAGLHPEEVWPRWAPLHVAGVAATNYARTRCPAGHRYDGTDSRGFRTCSTCHADAVRRHRAKTHVRTLVTGAAP